MNPEESFHAIIKQSNILKQTRLFILETSHKHAYLQALYKLYANLGFTFLLGNHDNVDHFPLHNENHLWL